MNNKVDECIEAKKVCSTHKIKAFKEFLMEKQDVNSKKYYTIDLAHIVKSLWQKVWIILLAAVLTASVGFGYSAFFIKPTYSSTILVYVNNSTKVDLESFKLSASDLTAAQSLVDTYGVMLANRTSLERVMDEADVKYEFEEILGMVKSGSVKETEVMYVTVTCEDPYEAAKIANCIAEVLPGIIRDITDGAAEMVPFDYAVPNLEKVAPSITKYTAVGFIIGMLIAMVIVVVMAMMDDRIHDEDYIISTYDYPILAKIPDLVNTPSGKSYNNYNYYYSSGSRHRSRAKSTDNSADASDK